MTPNDSDLQNYLILFALVVVLISIIFFIISRVRKNADIRGISQTIASISMSSIKDISMLDEIDGYVMIDYCIMTPKGILVILMQNYPGNLFGGDSIDSWTQVYQHRSYQFDNPLRHRQKCLHAMQEYIPGVPVVAQVVFTNVGNFPKGKPSHVSMLNDLKDDLGDFLVGGEPADHVKTSWRKLEALKWSASAEGRAASINAP